MPWRPEADAVLALTGAARTALARGEVDTLNSLLDERAERIRRLAAFAPAATAEPELAAMLAAITEQEKRLAEQLRAGLRATGAALTSQATAACTQTRPPSSPTYDRKA